VIIVVAVAGIVTVQDLGRPGRLHEGVPPGGALVPELLALANAAAGNGGDEAGLEIVGSISVAASVPTVVATDDGARHELRAGAPWTASSAGARVRYLAVRGGIDVPVTLGGRGTLVVAGLGGYEGRALRAGDRLAVGASPVHDGPRVAPPDLTGAIRVVLGPDLDRFDEAAVEVLLAGTYRVDPRSDRVGLRLHGPPIGRHGDDNGPSGPMVRGAIQVPPSGQPIVLGPDHPTMGGYPVLATVQRSSFGALASRQIGAEVRFVVTSS
jgi:5-oxoprolinase (ATP-hydrolysing) subunit C